MIVLEKTVSARGASAGASQTPAAATVAVGCTRLPVLRTSSRLRLVRQTEACERHARETDAEFLQRRTAGD